jgi:hypothetical protein
MWHSMSAPNTITKQLLNEGIHSLTKALAKAGMPRSYRTALRWALHGTKGVVLESCKVGGLRMTSVQAALRFAEATTAIASRPNAPTPARARASRGSATDSVLEGYGLGRETTQ